MGVYFGLPGYAMMVLGNWRFNELTENIFIHAWQCEREIVG